MNPCRPVLIGSEVYLTQRSTIVTHNIGHSVLEGYENRFAPVVIEDRAQVGIGTVVYAGCRIGQGAIVASSSYVVSDIPAGKLAIGVPARVVGEARIALSRSRQAELARRFVVDLRELLELRGHEVSALEDGDAPAFEVKTEDGPARIVFVERLTAGDLAAAPGGTVALTLEYSGGELADGCAVLALLAPGCARPGRHRARYGPRVLPEARDPFRAGPVALRRRPDLTGRAGQVRPLQQT